MHLCIEVYLVFCNNESIKKHKMQSISVVIELNKYNNALYIHILIVSVIMDKVIHFGTISNKK